MTPELNREVGQPGEDDIFDQMVKITIDQMQTEDGRCQRAARGGADKLIQSTRKISEACG